RIQSALFQHRVLGFVRAASSFEIGKTARPIVFQRIRDLKPETSSDRPVSARTQYPPTKLHDVDFHLERV
ncbi:MAG: hypothetical protein ACXVZX_08815, partial [Terriglobales bacterium]